MMAEWRCGGGRNIWELQSQTQAGIRENQVEMCVFKCSGVPSVTYLFSEATPPKPIQAELPTGTKYSNAWTKEDISHSNHHRDE